MNRAALLSTVPSGLIDEHGASIPSTRQPATVDARTLPLIDAAALPPLPLGIEARLYQDPDGDNHAIVLWAPVYQVSVHFPLADHIEDRTAIVRAAAAMVAAFPTKRAA